GEGGAAQDAAPAVRVPPFVERTVLVAVEVLDGEAARVTGAAALTGARRAGAAGVGAPRAGARERGVVDADVRSVERAVVVLVLAPVGDLRHVALVAGVDTGAEPFITRVEVPRTLEAGVAATERGGRQVREGDRLVELVDVVPLRVLREALAGVADRVLDLLVRVDVPVHGGARRVVRRIEELLEGAVEDVLERAVAGRGLAGLLRRDPDDQLHFRRPRRGRGPRGNAVDRE